ncbi:MAG: dihydrolipoyl dehydrogenase [Candidatus Omnitrophota bacterium]
MYDLTIIGAGTGGYAAAIRAVGLGAKVCLIEKDLLGGTCLNRGCIPTKSIIQSIKVLQSVLSAKEFGVNISGFSLDIDHIFKRKDDLVLKLRQSMESQLKSKGIDIVKGSAQILDENTIKVSENQLSSKYIIIAAGSHPLEVDGLKPDHKYLLSSDDILEYHKIPKKLIIVGGGYIGCEFASIYSNLGCEVTIVEIQNQLLPSADRELAKRLESIFRKAGVDIIKGSKVVSVDSKGGVRINLEGERIIEADIALLSIGRKPNIDGLNLGNVGIQTDGGGIVVNNRLRTNIENIYAIGDVTGRHFLAHVAAYEGMIASDNIFGKQRFADYSAVPSCIFTSPEIASAGLTEEKAKELDLELSITKIPFAALSKSHITDKKEGIIKLISDKKSDMILGVQIIGDSASELLAGFVIAMQNKLTLASLCETIFAHPTLSEGIWETAYRASENKSETLNTRS